MMNILICGDYIVGDLPVNKSVFGDLLPIIKMADFSVYNQEHPVTKSASVYKTKKFGPLGYCDPKQINAVSDAGFNVATLANNHIYNRGMDGLLDTLNNLNDAKIKTVGAGRNLTEAKYIAYLKKEGTTVGLINVAEHEFNTATDYHGGANPLDIIDNIDQLIEAKRNADFVIIIIHGGIEYLRTPTPYLVKTARFLVDHGADAIVCHHTHVVSGYEEYKGSPIIYGLGNLIPIKHINGIFNNKYCLESLVVSFNIDRKEGLKYKLIPIEFNKEKSALKLMKGVRKKQLFEELEDNEFYSNSRFLKKKVIQHLEESSRLVYYYTLFTKTNYTIFKVFRKFKLMFLFRRYVEYKMKNSKKNSIMWNLLRCESNRDLYNCVYEEYIDEKN